ncbi:MAG: dihydrofolate reductase [Proteobacteria bacterium]|nr:dihydrofolate reductase [Pseudomonadota bacterium]
MISAIAAVGKNNIIGKDNKLLWRLPLELKYFKTTTIGHHLIMGRKTFESHPPLPGRTSIVLTRDGTYEVPEGCIVAHTLTSALEIARSRGEREVFIVGGEEVYTLALPLIQKLYLTDVDFEGEADAYFPKVDFSEWGLDSEKHVEASEKNPYAWTAKVYTRKSF